MGLFHRKTNAEKAGKDKELISLNERSVDALIILAEQSDNEKTISEFKQIKERLKYLIASEKEEILDYDRKIKNLIEDLKIALVKSDGNAEAQAVKLTTQIKVAIAERNARL